MNSAIAPSAPHPGVDALLVSLYSASAEDRPLDEILELACHELAALLKLRMVAIACRKPGGMVSVAASSAHDALWLELQKLPERCDAGLVGNGPAAQALRSGETAILRVDDEAFLPWREAARRDGVRCGAAFPLDPPDSDHVLEVFTSDDQLASDTARRAGLAAIARALGRLLRSDARLRHRRLLAAALEGAGVAAFLTDRDGTLVWTNPAFAKLSGHAAEAVVGKNARVLQSGKQGLRYYRKLWSTIRAGEVWRGETFDKTRSGDGYVVRQTISPVAIDGRYTHYLALQDDVTGQKARQVEHELHIGRDDVTNLLTRPSFERMVAAALDRGPDDAQLVLISTAALLDAIDRRGADTDATILEEVGDRLLTIVEAPAFPGASAGILSRGEFLVWLDGEAAAPGSSARLLDRLRHDLGAPYYMPGGSVQAEIAVAIAKVPDDGATFDALLRVADRKLADEPMRPARCRVPDTVVNAARR